MDIRLAAMDLDGTLLDSRKEISAGTCAVLRACQAKGVEVVFASGRGVEAVAALARAVGLHGPLITANGGRVDGSPAGDILYLDPFPRPLAQRAFDLLMDLGVCFVLYGPGVVYQLNASLYGRDRGLGKGPLAAGGEAVRWEPVAVVRDPAVACRQGLGHVLKMVLFSQDPAQLQEAAQLLAAHTPCQLSSSGRDNLEVMAPGGGKGRALAFLMGRLGLKKEQVMAFGDSTNDLDMLGAAGWPVAMGNALDVVKALAWRVAPSCDQDGVARTLQECVLGNSAMEAQA